MTRSNPRQMTRWLAQRERHGWSWAELSERSGHPVWKLRYWQRRAEGAPAKPDRSGGFVAVEVTEPVATSPPTFGALEITTPSGYRVTVAHDFDPEHLRRVVQALERGC
jgi:uncharacterized protein (DUF2249 family)